MKKVSRSFWKEKVVTSLSKIGKLVSKKSDQIQSVKNEIDTIKATSQKLKKKKKSFSEFKDLINGKVNGSKYTLLFRACENSLKNVVDTLLTIRGIDVDKGKVGKLASNSSDTPLGVSISKKNEAIINILLKKRAKTSIFMFSDLFKIICNRLVSKSHLLEENTVMLVRGLQKIMKSKSNREKVSQYKKLVNGNAWEGNTLLFVACKKGCFEVVKEILQLPWIKIEKGTAGANAKGIVTPLMISIQKKYYNIVGLLLKKGADPNLESKNEVEKSNMKVNNYFPLEMAYQNGSDYSFMILGGQKGIKQINRKVNKHSCEKIINHLVALIQQFKNDAPSIKRKGMITNICFSSEHLEGKYIGDHGLLSKILKIYYCNTIVSLDISNCGIGEEGCKHVRDMLKGMKKMYMLNISDNAMIGNGLESVIEGIQACSSIQRIVLSKLKLSNKNLFQLIHLCSMKDRNLYLNIDNCVLEDERKVINLLKCGHGLKMLSMEGVLLKDDTAYGIVKSLCSSGINWKKKRFALNISRCGLSCASLSLLVKIAYRLGFDLTTEKRGDIEMHVRKERDLLKRRNVEGFRNWEHLLKETLYKDTAKVVNRDVGDDKIDETIRSFINEDAFIKNGRGCVEVKFDITRKFDVTSNIEVKKCEPRIKENGKTPKLMSILSFSDSGEKNAFVIFPIFDHKRTKVGSAKRKFVLEEMLEKCRYFGDILNKIILTDDKKIFVANSLIDYKNGNLHLVCDQMKSKKSFKSRTSSLILEVGKLESGRLNVRFSKLFEQRSGEFTIGELFVEGSDDTNEQLYKNSSKISMNNGYYRVYEFSNEGNIQSTASLIVEGGLYKNKGSTSSSVFSFEGTEYITKPSSNNVSHSISYISTDGKIVLQGNHENFVALNISKDIEISKGAVVKGKRFQHYGSTKAIVVNDAEVLLKKGKTKMNCCSKFLKKLPLKIEFVCEVFNAKKGQIISDGELEIFGKEKVTIESSKCIAEGGNLRMDGKALKVDSSRIGGVEIEYKGRKKVNLNCKTVCKGSCKVLSPYVLYNENNVIQSKKNIVTKTLKCDAYGTLDGKCNVMFWAEKCKFYKGSYTQAKKKLYICSNDVNIDGKLKSTSMEIGEGDVVIDIEGVVEYNNLEMFCKTIKVKGKANGLDYKFSCDSFLSEKDSIIQSYIIEGEVNNVMDVNGEYCFNILDILASEVNLVNGKWKLHEKGGANCAVVKASKHVDIKKDFLIDCNSCTFRQMGLVGSFSNAGIVQIKQKLSVVFNEITNSGEMCSESFEGRSVNFKNLGKVRFDKFLNVQCFSFRNDGTIEGKGNGFFIGGKDSECLLNGSVCCIGEKCDKESKDNTFHFTFDKINCVGYIGGNFDFNCNESFAAYGRIEILRNVSINCKKEAVLGGNCYIGRMKTKDIVADNKQFCKVLGILGVRVKADVSSSSANCFFESNEVVTFEKGSKIYPSEKIKVKSRKFKQDEGSVIGEKKNDESCSKTKLFENYSKDVVIGGDVSVVNYVLKKSDIESEEDEKDTTLKILSTANFTADLFYIKRNRIDIYGKVRLGSGFLYCQKLVIHEGGSLIIEKGVTKIFGDYVVLPNGMDLAFVQVGSPENPCKKVEIPKGCIVKGDLQIYAFEVVVDGEIIGNLFVNDKKETFGEKRVVKFGDNCSVSKGNAIICYSEEVTIGKKCKITANDIVRMYECNSFSVGKGSSLNGSEIWLNPRDYFKCEGKLCGKKVVIGNESIHCLEILFTDFSVLYYSDLLILNGNRCSFDKMSIQTEKGSNANVNADEFLRFFNCNVSVCNMTIRSPLLIKTQSKFKGVNLEERCIVLVDNGCSEKIEKVYTFPFVNRIGGKKFNKILHEKTNTSQKIRELLKEELFTLSSGRVTLVVAEKMAQNIHSKLSKTSFGSFLFPGFRRTSRLLSRIVNWSTGQSNSIEKEKKFKTLELIDLYFNLKKKISYRLSILNLKSKKKTTKKKKFKFSLFLKKKKESDEEKVKHEISNAVDEIIRGVFQKVVEVEMERVSMDEIAGKPKNRKPYFNESFDSETVDKYRSVFDIRRSKAQVDTTQAKDTFNIENVQYEGKSIVVEKESKIKDSEVILTETFESKDGSDLSLDNSTVEAKDATLKGNVASKGSILNVTGNLILDANFELTGENLFKGGNTVVTSRAKLLKMSEQGGTTKLTLESTDSPLEIGRAQIEVDHFVAKNLGSLNAQIKCRKGDFDLNKRFVGDVELFNGTGLYQNVKVEEELKIVSKKNLVLIGQNSRNGIKQNLTAKSISVKEKLQSVNSSISLTTTEGDISLHADIVVKDLNLNSKRNITNFGRTIFASRWNKLRAEADILNTYRGHFIPGVLNAGKKLEVFAGGTITNYASHILSGDTLKVHGVKGVRSIAGRHTYCVVEVKKSWWGLKRKKIYHYYTQIFKSRISAPNATILSSGGSFESIGTDLLADTKFLIDVKDDIILKDMIAVYFKREISRFCGIKTEEVKTRTEYTTPDYRVGKHFEMKSGRKILSEGGNTIANEMKMKAPEVEITRKILTHTREVEKLSFVGSIACFNLFGKNTPESIEPLIAQARAMNGSNSAELLSHGINSAIHIYNTIQSFKEPGNFLMKRYGLGGKQTTVTMLFL